MNEPAYPQFVPRIPADPALPPGDRDWQAGWPRQDYIELAAVREAVPSARHRTRLVLREWQAAGEQAYGDDLCGDAEQVTAELVANAVTATRQVTWVPKTPPVRFWLLGRGQTVAVAVWDATTGVPAPRSPTTAEESGRGLLLVAGLARWGWYLPAPRHGGKLVYARLPKSGTLPPPSEHSFHDHGFLYR